METNKDKRQGNYMSLKMIANGKAREHVEQLKPFRGSNLWGEWRTWIDGELPKYVVYSYRYTFPLFVYDQIADQWYENNTQFSSTTTRHRAQYRPYGVETIKLCVDDMEIVARQGGVGLISKGVV
jgi:alpha-L-fucosidase